MASEEVDQLAIHSVRLLRRVLNGVRGAMAQMVLEQPAGDLAKRLVHGGNLDENVGAITIFFNHSLKSADLSFDASQAVEIGGLDLWIHGYGMFAGSRSRMFGFVWHGKHYTP